MVACIATFHMSLDAGRLCMPGLATACLHEATGLGTSPSGLTLHPKLLHFHGSLRMKNNSASPSPATRKPADAAPLRRTRGPSPQKTELTRTEILAAALDEFTEVGIAKATMDRIAKRANLAKGTLYLHFANKEALLEGALQATISQSALASMQTPRLPGESVRKYILRVALPPMERFHTTGRAALARLVLGEARSHPSLMRFYHQNIFLPWHAHFERLFQQARAEGELHGITPKMASQLLGAPFWLSLVEDAITPEERAQNLSAAELTRAQIDLIFRPARPKEPR